VTAQPFRGLTLLSGSNRTYLSPGLAVHDTQPHQASSSNTQPVNVPGTHSEPRSTHTSLGSVSR
jgi:hypothetical protein